MLINMIDGGMKNYNDNSQYYSGCPTCDYGSEYINEIWIELTKYKVYVKVNQMYEYAISQGKMMVLFLSNCNEIQAMTEKEFIDWLLEKLKDIVGESNTHWNNSIIECFNVTEVS